VCVPGDQAYCNWMGACDAGGQACICTDPQHWFASERCSTWHAGPQPLSCPAAIYLANGETTPDGMQGNGGFLEYTFVSTQNTGAGLTCRYTRPNDDNFAQFIGRDLNAGETSATPASANSWTVSLSGGGSTTVTCRNRAILGPLSYYRPTPVDSLVSVPSGWETTETDVQSLVFDRIETARVFDMECHYLGFTDVTVYIPPAPRTYSAASCPGLYTSGASLSTRLAACPGLQDLLLWESAAGAITSHSGHSYPSWTAQQKARLDALFAAIEANQSNLGIDCPVPAQNLWTAGQTNSGGNPVHTFFAIQMFFTANQAFDTYAAHVAWTIYVEVNHLVPWSILNHPPVELAELFDARRHHTRFPARSFVHASGYQNPADYPTHILDGRDYWNATSRKSAAWEAVCDPRVGYQFLSGARSTSGANMIGANQVATLKNLTWWFHNDAAHGAPQDSQTATLFTNSSFFLSNRLQARPDAFFPSQPLVIANAGCHSAGNLFYDLAKSINIPILHVAVTMPDPPGAKIHIDFGRHTGLVYGWGTPASTLVLWHTDEMYAQYGLIFPVTSGGQPVSDPAQALFAATWLPPAQLTPWGLTLTNDYTLQTPFTIFGNRSSTETGTNGVMAGYWTPTPPPAFGNSSRNLYYVEQLLCSFGGGHNVMSSCGQSPASLQAEWMSQFGSNVLQSLTGHVSINATDYMAKIQTCANAYTGLSGSAACGQFQGPNSPYRIQLENRTATSSWSGPAGQ
jgi:hypothetical protein